MSLARSFHRSSVVQLSISFQLAGLGFSPPIYYIFRFGFIVYQIPVLLVQMTGFFYFLIKPLWIRFASHRFLSIPVSSISSAPYQELYLSIEGRRYLLQRVWSN